MTCWLCLSSPGHLRPAVSAGITAAATLAIAVLLLPDGRSHPAYAAPQTKITIYSSARKKNTHPSDLPNFAEVAPGIYRGAAPTPAGWARLHALGVRTEVDLRIEKKGRAEAEAATRQYGINRLLIPLGREAPTARQVHTFLTTLDNPARRPVFIHCQYGADRTGAMVGIYREVRQGWDFDRTYAEMRRYGFKPYLTELKGAVQQRAPKQQP